MRRILLAATGTLAAVVAVFLYPTSTDQSVAVQASTVSDTTTSATMADGTYTASSTMRYGTVTVTITVADGQITDASGVQDSHDNKSQMIASQAMPTLNSEAVSAQSASIAMVSHATFTSSAYEQSLQAAIDQAFA